MKDAAKKCNNECSEGVDCKNSWPYYAYKAPKEVRQNRCYEPPHYNGNVYVETPVDPPVATNPEPVEAIPEDRRIPLDASNVLMTSNPPSIDHFGTARPLTRLVEEPVSDGLHD